MGAKEARDGSGALQDCGRHGADEAGAESLLSLAHHFLTARPKVHREHSRRGSQSASATPGIGIRSSQAQLEPRNPLGHVQSVESIEQQRLRAAANAAPGRDWNGILFETSGEVWC